jgi:hypothetical protein
MLSIVRVIILSVDRCVREEAALGNSTLILFYTVFHRFRQAKFAYVGLILSLSQFKLPKNEAGRKSR